jgi:hypothetical protein
VTKPTQQDETLFTVLGEQARSRSRAGLWTTMVGGALSAGMVLFQYPSLSWVAAAFGAVAAYGCWGLIDRAIETNAHDETRVAGDSLPALRFFVAMTGGAAALWAVLGFLRFVLGSYSLR